MIKYKLQCKKCTKSFDSWFSSSKEFERIKKLKLLNCNFCKSKNIDKTLKSYLFAIIGAEYILKWLPIGTHDWDKFVKPDKLREIAKQNSLKFNKLDGVKLNLFLNKWRLSKDSSVNYISNFIKI